jgi:hypothetical protein
VWIQKLEFQSGFSFDVAHLRKIMSHIQTPSTNSWHWANDETLIFNEWSLGIQTFAWLPGPMRVLMRKRKNVENIELLFSPVDGKGHNWIITSYFCFQTLTLWLLQWYFKISWWKCSKNEPIRLSNSSMFLDKYCKLNNMLQVTNGIDKPLYIWPIMRDLSSFANYSLLIVLLTSFNHSQFCLSICRAAFLQNCDLRTPHIGNVICSTICQSELS